MGLKTFIESSRRLLKLSRKPGIDEFWLSVKICSVGIAIIGLVGFLIKLIGWVLGL
ncbi:protein translocase SEC61 complex subunit gamma [Candidatus Bathyarchaeota archaeon]|nr:protein translocase SEC61 complex subunit gamma [Candidatus Bathyarchaeota archaeon]MBS7627449.1 protein translocase SEC61 complex subunit gamma [Candidatus Bathyarchaeota archaeon]